MTKSTERLQVCDWCKRLGTTYQTPNYGSTWIWCNDKCFRSYLAHVKMVCLR